MQQLTLHKRTVVVRFPDGQDEYWLTDQAFEVGQLVSRNGDTTLIVSDILDPDRTGTHLTVTLRVVRE